MSIFFALFDGAPRLHVVPITKMDWSVWASQALVNSISEFHGDVVCIREHRESNIIMEHWAEELVAGSEGLILSANSYVQCSIKGGFAPKRHELTRKPIYLDPSIFVIIASAASR